MKKISMPAIRLYVILFLIFAVIAYPVVRSMDYSYYEYDRVEIDAGNLAVLEGYSADEQGYACVQEGARLIYYWENGGVFGVRLHFIEEPYEFRVYYADGLDSFHGDNTVGIYYNANKVVEAQFHADSRAVWLELPKGTQLEKAEMLVNRREEKVSVSFVWVPVISLILSLIIICFGGVRHGYERLEKSVMALPKKIWKNKQRLLFGLLELLTIYFGSVIVSGWIGRAFEEENFNTNRIWLIFALGLFLWTMFQLRNSLGKKPEILFAVAAISLGVVTIVSAPSAPGVCWDDEVHYLNTAELSYGGKGTFSVTDNMLVEKYQDVVYNKGMYGAHELAVWKGEINQHHAQNPVLMRSDKVAHGVHDIAYVPAAVGMMAARGLGLSYTNVFMAGKLMNMLTYVMLFFVAIRLVKRGKVLLCAIGLLPISLFLATNYAYDWWVHGFIALGYAMFIGEMQREKHAIDIKKWIAILFIMVIGIMPKAVYFPVIFPMLFIGRRRFKSNRAWYWATNIAAMLVLVLSFVLPMFIGGGGGDARGGELVDSAKQISFILQNPLSYTAILLNFLKSYVILDSNTLTAFAYMGEGHGANLVLVTLCAAAFLEGRRREEGVGIGFKRMLGVALFGAVCLAATALYISFTIVGEPTIRGCQVRYLYPLFFPLLYFFAETKIDTKKVNKNLFAGIVISIMTLVYMDAIRILCVEFRNYLM